MTTLEQFFPMVSIPNEARQALESGFDLAISISGGKDSDAMARLLVAMHREYDWSGRVVLVHADLGRAEHKVTPAYVARFAESLGMPLEVVHQHDLVDHIWNRFHKLQREGREAPPFPSAKNRYCTSDTKRAPISKFLRNWSGKNGRVICAMGLRADESSARAKRPVWQPRSNVHTKSRQAFDWLPIHQFSEADTWSVLGYTMDELAQIRRLARLTTPQRIFERGKFNAHPAYAKGNERLSCGLCILGCAGDLKNGADQNPEVYREYVDIEIASGYSFQQGKWLADVASHLLREEQLLAVDALKASREDTRS